MLSARHLVSAPISLGILCVLTGCADKAQIKELPPGEKNLRIIARAYSQAAQALGRSPNNAEELKPYLRDYGNPDELLVSPNDGKPYVIVGGVNLKQPNGMPVLAYEQEGRNGKRQYVDLRLSAQTATEEEFARLPIPEIQKPITDK